MFFRTSLKPDGGVIPRKLIGLIKDGADTTDSILGFAFRYSSRSLIFISLSKTSPVVLSLNV
jgi:hypothetical protein